ncbi:hypothetical protein Sjap_016946 [Stephania japonica]|uniref:Polyphenol oxidase C-terminal domain-containing protein n=1 Tax=Stephania japonica TaxID=461633 RepID=A0AAP0I5B4_9MAGN
MPIVILRAKSSRSTAAHPNLSLKSRSQTGPGLHVQDFGPKGLRLSTNVRLEVQRPKILREEEVLVVYGIEVVRDVYAKFDVFVNAVNASTIGAESREFAGTFVNLQKGVRFVRKSSPTILKLGISELLEDLEADEDESGWGIPAGLGIPVGWRMGVENSPVENFKRGIHALPKVGMGRAISALIGNISALITLSEEDDEE